MDEGLNVGRSAQVFSLIAAGAHPDLYVARPQVNEKTGRLSTEISVDTVRKLTHFMSRTASFGGWRVAIIDTADELNRNAANALLKVLEEPPPKSVLFLLSATPGRLLATIRSRCRKISLPGVSDEEISAFLKKETDLGADERARIAAASEGRPGRALRFAASDGAKAIELVDRFLDVAKRLTDAEVQALAGRTSAPLWSIFRPLLQRRLAGMVRSAAYDGSSDSLLRAHEEISELFLRGEAVNVDKAQLLSAAARRLREALDHGSFRA
jgi:DNA polymerase-3 subunit delta'